MPTVQVRRTGNARWLRAAIDGVQLEWQKENENDDARSVSKPKDLPVGEHVLNWFAKGGDGESYGFEVIQPPGTPCVIGPLTFEGEGFDFGDCVFQL
ncbi:MAG: hypothetical protein AAGA65_23800 [Actinomycetota bacterium]